ncbi:hypothetical protein GA0070616_5148 [Micromonospora nigra]|uniref:LppM domain-containing protein n=1 Tax=Micromonospora nigra TaxID=145857 RepID=A0A1C6T020_9ACTN|nr:DUF3153 domain-containing protein [Micromonospora nigra]SCL35138.1 hypothetical protein GA0070616_5148 [Micromonospora nigra]
MNTGSGLGRMIRGALCLALGMTLAGCLELNAGLDVSRDDTVSGQLLLTARKSILPKNKTPDQGFADLRRYVPALPVGEESRYEDAQSVGAQISYDRVPLREFSTESMKLIREGDRYIFTLGLDLSAYQGKITELKPSEQTGIMRLTAFEISVTFPGRVLDANGTVNDRSVTWKLVPNQPKPTELRAVAQAPPRPSAAGGSTGGIPWPLVVAGVAVLLVVAVLVVVLLRRLRPSGPGAPDEPGTTTTPAVTAGTAPGPG